MTSFLWAVLTIAAWGSAPIFEKLGLAKVSIVTGLFFRCLGVLIGFGFLLLFKFPSIKDSLSTLQGGWWWFMASGFMASIVGQIFFYHSLQNAEASRIVPLVGAFPLVSFILGILILGETVTISKVGGVFLVILGVYFLK